MVRQRMPRRIAVAVLVGIGVTAVFLLLGFLGGWVGLLIASSVTLACYFLIAIVGARRNPSGRDQG